MYLTRVSATEASSEILIAEMGAEQNASDQYNHKDPNERFPRKYKRSSIQVMKGGIAGKQETLSLTSAATIYHSFRGYYQKMDLKGISLNATEYGWKLVDEKLVPIKTQNLAGPQELLKAMFFICKSQRIVQTLYMQEIQFNVYIFVHHL